MPVTAADLLARSDANLLAQISVPADMPLLESADFRKAITDGVDSLTGEQKEQATLVINRINQALTDASDLVNSYINASYTDVPSSLVNATSAIAMWYLHSYAGGEAPEDIQKRYDNAIAWLKDIASGKASLPADPGAEDADGDGEPDDTASSAAQIERTPSFMDLGDADD